MLEKATIPMNASQIKKMVLADKLDFNHVVQRGLTWETARKSKFIHSMIEGYPFPSVYAKREVSEENKSNKRYIVLDGKQRLTTVKQYLNDEFKLSVVEPITYFDEIANEEVTVDISGKLFSELPESLQNVLNTVSFTVVYYDNLTKEQEREMFKRLNAGKPLSSKSRLLASCRDIERMLDIGSHPLFGELLTDKAREHKSQVTIVMKAWLMLYDDIGHTSFAGKDFSNVMETTEIADKQKIELHNVFSMIMDMHNILIGQKEKKVAKKLYTETHMISLVPFIKKAMDDGIGAEMLVDWLISFFGVSGRVASVDRDYNMSCSSGSAKNSNIVTRHDALEKSYEEFFADFNAEVEEADDVEDIDEVEEVMEETTENDTVEEKSSFEDSSDNTEEFIEDSVEEVADVNESSEVVNDMTLEEILGDVTIEGVTDTAEEHDIVEESVVEIESEVNNEEIEM